MPNSRRSPDFQPELRKNVVTREWVIIARGRVRRPSDLARETPSEAPLPAHDPTCPFCPGSEPNTPPEVFALPNGRVRNGPNWKCRVVPNKFAALRLDGSDQLHLEGVFTWRDGFGAHEVIIETPQHNVDLWEMEEQQSGERVILETDHFLVVAAFAAHYPYETWVLPKRHAVRFADISEEEARDFARVLKITLGKMAGCLARPSYNFAIHSAPMDLHSLHAYHWHMEIFPRITTLGGFELGSNIYINIATPEEAAAFLRETPLPVSVAAG